METCFKKTNLTEKIKNWRFFEVRLIKEHYNIQERIFRRKKIQTPVAERMRHGEKSQR